MVPGSVRAARALRYTRGFLKETSFVVEEQLILYLRFLESWPQMTTLR
jgi:hypothetical protein